MQLSCWLIGSKHGLQCIRHVVWRCGLFTIWIPFPISPLKRFSTNRHSWLQRHAGSHQAKLSPAVHGPEPHLEVQVTQPAIQVRRHDSLDLTVLVKGWGRASAQERRFEASLDGVKAAVADGEGTPGQHTAHVALLSRKRQQFELQDHGGQDRGGRRQDLHREQESLRRAVHGAFVYTDLTGPAQRTGEPKESSTGCLCLYISDRTCTGAIEPKESSLGGLCVYPVSQVSWEHMGKLAPPSGSNPKTFIPYIFLANLLLW